MIYLFCVKWRSSINIASMRYFNTLAELEDHIRYNGTPQQWNDHAAGTWHAYRVYSNGAEAKALPQRVPGYRVASLSFTIERLYHR